MSCTRTVVIQRRDPIECLDRLIFGKFFSGCNFAADTLKSKTSFREIRFGCKHHEMDHLAIKAHWPPEGHSAEDEISLTIRADQRNQPEEMHAFVMRQLQLLPPFISSEYFQSTTFMVQALKLTPAANAEHHAYQPIGGSDVHENQWP